MYCTKHSFVLEVSSPWKLLFRCKNCPQRWKIFRMEWSALVLKGFI